MRVIFKNKIVRYVCLIVASLNISLSSIELSQAASRIQSSGERASSSQQHGSLGLGFMLGEPTGVSLKSWMSRTSAFDVGLSYSFSNYFEVLADYLYHFPRALPGLTNGKISDEFIPYVGIGGALFFDLESRSPFGHYRRRVADGANIGLALRFPLGLEFLPKKVPLGIFAELVPGMGLVPETYGILEGVVGARYYF